MVRIVLIAGTVLTLCNVASLAQAQYVPPGGPTLPVELEYFRPRQGVLDNYNQFVAPRQALANQLRSMDQRQSTEFRAVESKIRQVKSIRESDAAPTGTSAGFMNYSHYFPTPGGVGRRR